MFLFGLKILEGLGNLQGFFAQSRQASWRWQTTWVCGFGGWLGDSHTRQ